jgi:hypothetical protein
MTTLISRCPLKSVKKLSSYLTLAENLNLDVIATSFPSLKALYVYDGNHLVYVRLRNS